MQNSPAPESLAEILPKRLINETMEMLGMIYPQTPAIYKLLKAPKSIKMPENTAIQANSLDKKIFLNMFFLSNNFRAKINKSIQKSLKNKQLKAKITLIKSKY